MKAYHKSGYVHIFVLFLLVGIGAGCKSTPEKTTPRFQPDQESIKLGREGLIRFEKKITYYADEGLQQYVQQVGQNILGATPAKHASFTFRIIESAIPQAYALPDGHIFVTTGMLALFSNESQLAALLGHEIAHVIAGHTLRRFKKRKQIELLTRRLNRSLDSKNTREMTRLFGRVSIQNYSRKNEYQADALAVGFLEKSHYSKHAMIDVLRRLNLSGLTMNEDKQARKSIFSSHPAIEKRIEKLKSLFQYKKTDLEKKYLFRVNNLVLTRKKGKHLLLKLHHFSNSETLKKHLERTKKRNRLLYNLILAINFAHSENDLDSSQLIKWLVVTENK